MSWAVVVPTNRPEQLVRFMDAWQPLFDRHDVQLFVVVDDETTWATLPDWVPRRSDMIRSWGFLKAYRTDVDYVLTLDDDTLPSQTWIGGDIFQQYEQVFESGAVLSDYLDVGALTTSGLQMRGFPYGDRVPQRVAVQYGGWHGVLDYDARTQLDHPRGREHFKPVVLPVPRGVAATCCIMNCAFRRDVTPIMWQLPLVDGRYNRWGDIWSGLIQKRVLDRIGQVMVINGKASVLHERASDPNLNLVREAPGVPFNEGALTAESMWECVEPYLCKTNDMLSVWRDATNGLASAFFHEDGEYYEHFIAARDAWLAALAEVPAHA